MSKEYIDIYNNSLGDFLDVFSQNYNLDNKELKEKYTYVYSKKLTGYMLFVKDIYQTNTLNSEEKFSNNSKIISNKWKTLDKNIKQTYINKASTMNNKYKKVKKVKKVEEKKEPEKPTIDYNNKLDDRTLFEYEKDGKKYIKDIYNNLIDISQDIATYIGYIKDDEVFLY